MEKKKRDNSIDVLRFFAITGIILVHLEPSFWLWQIRAFDVPLMVFLSGVSYRLSGGCMGGYLVYVNKRFQRLVLPTWIFLAFFELICYLTLFMIGKYEGVDWNTILSHFTFQTTWFVWIIRVFFVVALVAPLMEYIINKSNWWIICCSILLAYLILEITYNISSNEYYQYFMITWPYIIVFVIGYYAYTYSSVLSFSCSILFFTCWFTYSLIISRTIGYFPLSEIQKYTPRFLYLSYALGCTFLIWSIRHRIYTMFQKLKIDKMIIFIGSHTLWIYLWHILFWYVDYLVLNPRDLPFVSRFFFLYLMSIIVVWGQDRLVDLIISKFGERNNSMLKRIFIG